MKFTDRLSLALLLLRLSVFLVMIMWTFDKFLRPDHAANVFKKFYFISGLGHETVYFIGVVELLLLAGFILGVYKRWTYGAVLLLHTVSTVSAFPNYLAPFNGPNLLFFAAWPMLAACAGLYMLKEHDTWWVLKRGNGNKESMAA